MTTDIKNGEYTLELTFSEIEFIRRSIAGIHDFLRSLHGEKDTSIVLYNLYGDIELNDIELMELENKIYSQYHSLEGTIVEQNVKLDTQDFGQLRLVDKTD